MYCDEDSKKGFYKQSKKDKTGNESKCDKSYQAAYYHHQYEDKSCYPDREAITNNSTILHTDFQASMEDLIFNSTISYNSECAKNSSHGVHIRNNLSMAAESFGSDGTITSYKDHKQVRNPSLYLFISYNKHKPRFTKILMSLFL